ncbi:unnamed protein product [Ilex paraguariensis]|uniref:F-box domain-containing protein n=1 Tax=Ilex paraguariensis TaxID=185542 RepID=A0ABC8RG28_9AQUA
MLKKQRSNTSLIKLFPRNFIEVMDSSPKSLKALDQKCHLMEQTPDYDYGVDRVSDLPDDILCHILSFLPTRFSAATTFLSTSNGKYEVVFDTPALSVLEYYNVVGHAYSLKNWGGLCEAHLDLWVTEEQWEEGRWNYCQNIAEFVAACSGVATLSLSQSCIVVSELPLLFHALISSSVSKIFWIALF